MQPITRLLVAGLLLIVAYAGAQTPATLTTSFSPSTIPTAPIGTQISLDLKVTNFTNVQAFQFPVNYNGAVLRLDSIDNPMIPGFNDTTNASFPLPNVAVLSWFYNATLYPTGISIPNNTTVMTFRFTVIGTGTVTVNIGPAPPRQVEASNVQNQNIPVSYQNGGSTIVAGSGGVNGCMPTGNPPNAPTYTGFKIITNSLHLLPGERGCMPVVVNDFTSVTAFQYTITWDPTVLQFECERAFNLPDLAGTFGGNTAQGKRTIVWVDNSPLVSGVTRANGTAIYEICFRGIGSPGAQTIFDIDKSGFNPPSDVVEATNANGQALWTSGTPVRDTAFIINPALPTCSVEFTADKDSSEQNQQVCVDIKASKFFWVTNAEFLVSYDATKLQFQSFDLGANPLNLTTSGANANLSQSTGFIRFKYTNNTGNGATVNDNTTLFSICFNPTGAPNTQSDIKFTSNMPCANTGAAIGASRKNIGSVPIKVTDGHVFIEAGSVPVVTVTVVNPQCAGGNGAFTTNVQNGTPASYSWAGPNGYTSAVANPTNVTAAGVYTVTVTMSGGGTASATATLTVPGGIVLNANQITMTAVTCNGLSNGAISIAPTGGTAPLNYSWSGPGGFTANTKDISNRPSGQYIVTITDANGCSFVSPAINITQPQAVTLPTNGITVTNVKCNQGTNGAITIAPSGGTSPYTVSWSAPGGYTGSGLTISNLSARAYTPTITDSKGCNFVGQPINVTHPTPINVSLGAIDDVACFNTATGGITINVSGGTPNAGSTYNYLWVNFNTFDPVSQVKDPSGLAAGQYNVTVTDANNCTATLPPANVPVTVQGPNTQFSVTLVQKTDITCPGTNNGSVTLSAAGGWPGTANYAWSGGLPPISDPTGVLAGTYTATVTDPGGCSVTQSVTIVEPPLITIGTPVVNNVSCAGTGNGSITITPGGGNGSPYAVVWSNTTLTGSSIGNLSGNTYAPTLTDAIGCTAVFAGIVVSEPAPIVLNATVTPQNGASPNGAINLSVQPLNAAYGFSWAPNGASTQNLSNLSGGNYTVTVTDQNTNCTAVLEVVVPQDNVLAGAVIDSVDASCGDDGCIYFSVPPAAISLAPFTYNWTGNTGTPGFSNSTTMSICGLQASPLAPYTITITASNGNTITVQSTVPKLDGAVIGFTETPPFDDLKNGSIFLVPAGFPAAYQWNNPLIPNISNPTMLDSGLYVVTVTNLNSGCTAVYEFYLERQYGAPSGAFSGITQPNCAGTNSGSINFNFEGADGPNYQYSWAGPNGFSAATKNIQNLAPGAYTVTVTDESGTQFVFDTLLVAQSNLAVTNVNETSTCGQYQLCSPNACNGMANVVVAGGVGAVNISWSNGVTSMNNNTLCAGPYSVTATDALGCSSVWSGELTAPPAISAPIQTSEPSCNSDCDGVATAIVSGGGQNAYVVRWSTGQIDNLSSPGIVQAGGLCAGAYTITVTDALGASQTFVFEINEPAPIILEFNPILPGTFNSCDGEMLVVAQNAAFPADYVWSATFGKNGQGQRAENLCAGEIIQFVVTDANGCVATGLDTIPFPADGCMTVRPVLTPGDQDGNNDYLLISCIETVTHSVEIYNRWGQLVFQSDNYVNSPSVDPLSGSTWYGLNRQGEPYAEGVYFYILRWTDEDGNKNERKGHINLLR